MTDTEEKKATPIADAESPTAEKPDFSNAPLVVGKDDEIQKSRSPITATLSGNKTVESESESASTPTDPQNATEKPQEPSHQDQEEHALIQSLAAQEPEPDPESPPMSKQEQYIDAKSNRTTSEVMIADAEALPFMEENISIFNSQKDL